MAQKNYMKRRGFTLVELLVVMGIMALIIMAATPMFNGMTRSSGMQGATMQLRSTLSLARQWAITHRVNTYVVFPNSDTNSLNDPNSLRAYHAYNVMTTDSVAKANIFLRDWVFLPPGFFFSDHGDSSSVLASAWASGANRVDGVPYTPSSGMPAIVFRPDGSSTGLIDMYNQPTIYIMEGIPTISGSTVIWQPRANSIINEIQVSSMAGLIKILQPST